MTTFDVLLLNLTSTKQKTRHDTIANLKCIVSDKFIMECLVKKSSLRSLILSMLTFAKIECKSLPGSNASEKELSHALRERLRLATGAIKWALSVADKVYPMDPLQPTIIKQVVSELFDLCSRIPLVAYAEVLASLNLYILNKREYLAQLDVPLWKQALRTVAGLARTSNIDRKEAAQCLAYLSMNVPVNEAEPLHATDTLLFDIGNQMLVVLQEASMHPSRSEEYTIMLMVRYLDYVLAHLYEVNSFMYKAVLQGLLKILGTFLHARSGQASPQLFIDIEVCKLVARVMRQPHSSSKEGQGEWARILGTLTIPPHLDLIDPIDLLGQDSHRLNQQTAYLKNLLHLRGETRPREGLLLQAKKIDIVFIEQAFMARNAAPHPLRQLYSIDEAIRLLPQMEIKVSCWHLTLLAELGVPVLAQEHLHRLDTLVPFLFRRATSAYCARLFRKHYEPANAARIHQLLLQIFQTQSPVLSVELLGLLRRTLRRTTLVPMETFCGPDRPSTFTPKCWTTS